MSLNHAGWYVANFATASSSSLCSLTFIRSPSLSWNSVGCRAWERFFRYALISNVSRVYLGVRGSVGFRVVFFVAMNRSIFCLMTRSSRYRSCTSQCATSASRISDTLRWKKPNSGSRTFSSYSDAKIFCKLVTSRL